MQAVLSREQMRAFDRLAIDECRVPGIVLMENAGRGAAELIHRRRHFGALARICVVCGPGNNGGDGYVVARRLKTLGREVLVLSAVPLAQLQGDAAVNAQAWRGIGGEVEELDGEAMTTRIATLSKEPLILVDALLGTGLDREVRDDYRRVIDAINQAPAHRVALDLPSGLDANTGKILGSVVRADMTITFAHPKLGLLTTTGSTACGTLRVVDIGVPGALWKRVGRSADWPSAADIHSLLPGRPRDANKVRSGRVAVVGGSPGMVGAALLAAHGALRAGAGLVTIASHPEAISSIEGRLFEAMTYRISPNDVAASLNSLLENQTSVLVGPGLGLDECASQIVDHIALAWPGTVVLDADALTYFRGQPQRLQNASGPRVLTPHSGELARLMGTSTESIENDRFGAVRQAVQSTGAVVVLKGPCTLIAAPNETPRLVANGPRTLATGGAGDVLGGIIAALACQLRAFDAATVGAWLHGAAATDWSASAGNPDRGLLAHEIADRLPVQIAALTRGHAKLTD